MLKILLLVGGLVSLNLKGYSQDNTLQIYRKSIEKCLNEIKINKHDTVYIIVEGGDISQTITVGDVILKPADAIFFDNLKGDTTFELLKLFPIKIIKEDVMVSINHYNFKQRQGKREMIYTGSYYSYFKFDCRIKKYVLYRTEKKVL